jgi:hypothetical protein
LLLLIELAPHVKELMLFASPPVFSTATYMLVVCVEKVNVEVTPAGVFTWWKASEESGGGGGGGGGIPGTRPGGPSSREVPFLRPSSGRKRTGDDSWFPTAVSPIPVPYRKAVLHSPSSVLTSWIPGANSVRTN